MLRARGLTLSVLLLLASTPVLAQGFDFIRLENAIGDKLGIRYRFAGIDDSGYDCSGLVWRVFSEAGLNFDRAPARALWTLFPQATETERREFGTLVFFNGVNHVGIVRDAFSFYHASRTQGVVISYFAGYWEKRITGFRVIPGPGPGMGTGALSVVVTPRATDPLTLLAGIPAAIPSFPLSPRER